MNTITNILSKSRQAIVAVVVCAIVLGVPVLTVMQVGRSVNANFVGEKVQPLESLQLRSADATDRPVKLFDEPLISVTFDDGHASTYEVAMPLLQKHGIRTTQYILSGTSNDPKYVSWKQIGEMQKAGHEIGCHSYDHADLRKLDDKALNFQLKDCKDQLTKRFGPIHSFASPYGSQDARTLRAVGSYFSNQRNTSGDPYNGASEADVNVSVNYDPMNIIGVTMRSDMTVDHLKDLVAFARKHNGWLVLTYHQANDKSSIYALDTEQFDTQFEYLSKSDVRIVTMHEAAKSLRKSNVGY